MSTALVTLRKELISYFFSPVGYVIAVLFYLVRGFDVARMTYAVAAFGGSQDDFAMAYTVQGFSSFAMIVLVPPLLTMRTFAEEKRTGSLEVLMTAPVRDWEVVLGKWVAALAFFAVLWLPTLIVLAVLVGPGFLAADVSFAPVLSGYLGLGLIAGLLLALGCFTSSLTDNQLLASLAAMLLGFALLYGVSWLAPQLGNLPQRYFAVRALVEQFDVLGHLQGGFSRGLIDGSQVVLYLGGTAFFLFLTTKSLEARRW